MSTVDELMRQLERARGDLEVSCSVDVSDEHDEHAMGRVFGCGFREAIVGAADVTLCFDLESVNDEGVDSINRQSATDLATERAAREAAEAKLEAANAQNARLRESVGELQSAVVSTLAGYSGRHADSTEDIRDVIRECTVLAGDTVDQWLSLRADAAEATTAWLAKRDERVRREAVRTAAKVWARTGNVPNIAQAMGEIARTDEAAEG